MLDDKSVFERIQTEKTMNTPLIKYTDVYKVIDSENVTLGIEIGEAQGGIIDVALDDQLLIKEQKFKVELFNLGSGAELKNKFLRIVAVVDDVTDSHDNASITYTFKGGKSDFKQTRPYVFVDGQKTVIFKIQVKFEF